MEIIFEKSRKNLKKVQNRLAYSSPGKRLNYEDVLFLAVGGYNRTYSLLLEMGLKKDEIATFDDLNLTLNFLQQTHGREVVFIDRLNYVTSSKLFNEATRRVLDLKVADSFEESMMIYSKATRTIGKGKNEVQWSKPSVVILNDPALNLQFGGHRFFYQRNLGFMQVVNRNADPKDILKEIADVEESDYMTFALYQNPNASEEDVKQALDKLKNNALRTMDGVDYFKPTEYKKIVDSRDVAEKLKEIEPLEISQQKTYSRIDKEVAKWVQIPHEAYDFKGFVFKDEEDLFQEEIEMEEQKEKEFELEQQRKLDAVLSENFNLNIRAGYGSKKLGNSGKETLQSFVEAVDEANDRLNSVALLKNATTEKEYNQIKKNSVIYFIDGKYKNDERSDANYLGGKRLIPIDVDDQEYNREQLEEKLEDNGYFGMIYPTARYYFDGSLRWRIVMVADDSFTKETYKHTVKGLAELLGIHIDDASAKLSQLAGYPFVKDDISFVVGSKVNVEQFQPTPKPKNVYELDPTKKVNTGKSLMDFDHRQAKDLKRALLEGINEGERNETYFGIMQYLNDTLADERFESKHSEAMQLKELVIQQMYEDGLDEKEVELLCRKQ